MKKQPVYFSIILIGILFATSCCPDKKYYRIKEKDKLTFKEGEMFVYKSNYNNYDTLSIYKIKSEMHYRESSEGFCSTDWYKENIEYYFDGLKTDSCLILKLIYNDLDDCLFFTMDFYPVVSQGIHINMGYSGKYLGNYYLNDSVYFNTKYETFNIVDSIKPYKYYFNKTYGFLSYEYHTGEKFYLLKYKLSDKNKTK